MNIVCFRLLICIQGDLETFDETEKTIIYMKKGQNIWTYTQEDEEGNFNPIKE